MAAQLTITDPSSPTTTVSGLLPSNSYEFEWTVTGFASCPPTKDAVTITVVPDLANAIDNTTQTVCYGQPVNIKSVAVSGGSGSYQYQWQQSTDGTNWAPLAGQTNADLSFTPAQNMYVRRVVTSAPCEKESASTTIVVQPPVSNNAISADQNVCINTAATILKGSVPAGANGSYLFQWQSSTNGGATWHDINGATLQDYYPGVLATTTRFRRNVASSLCSGPQSSNSNVITITVNPDARALFQAAKDSSCAPFNIDASVVQLQAYPDRNGAYEWYANDALIGSGSRFPGYTIPASGDSIKIKLITRSQFGCLPDSMEYTFYTFLEPKPSFDASVTEGCGPLTVLFTNTTPNPDLFTYQWNFGNGQISTQLQPGAISFLPNPNYGDTTYIVKLSAISPCNTLVFTQNVRVQSKPKALFAPSKTVGCSPMHVVFNNTSLGIGNSYIWDFGDGSLPVHTTSTDTIGHTYYTAVRDTFYARLIAVNQCGTDTLGYVIVVAPNTIKLDFAVNGNQQSGCTPHSVKFINLQGSLPFYLGFWRWQHH